MKRFLAMLMLVVMMCGCAGLAEGKTFDPSLLEGKEGYSYDKFKRTWYYYEGTAAIDGNDNVFMTQIGLMGEKKELTNSIVAFAVAKNLQPNYIDDVTKLVIMADNDLIIISNVLMINNELNNGQYAIALTEDKIKTLRMIVNAKKVSIRVYAKSAKNGYLDFEMEADLLAPLQDVTELVYTYELYSPYVSDEEITIVKAPIWRENHG